MKNKEEVLRALNWLIAEYERSLTMKYGELLGRNMTNGVCSKLCCTTKTDELGRKLIADMGHQYVKENKKHLKVLFPLCFKKSLFKMKSYWCELTPQIAYSPEELKQSLAIRFYILNEIKLKVQLL
jgi:hypothetical protein